MQTNYHTDVVLTRDDGPHFYFNTKSYDRFMEITSEARTHFHHFADLVVQNDSDRKMVESFLAMNDDPEAHAILSKALGATHDN